MATLIVEFSDYIADSGPAVVPLEILDSELRRVAGVPQSITLNQPTRIDLPSGDYLVRAFLPNGDVVSEQAQVSADETKLVPLVPEQSSPMESMAWGYILKAPMRSCGPYPMDGYAAVPDVTDEDVRISVWDAEDGNWQRRDNSVLEVFDRQLPGSYGWTELSTYSTLVSLRVEGIGPTRFVSLPPTFNVRINFRHAPLDDDDPLDVIVDSGNPRAETILEFLRRGDFAHARVIGSEFAQSAEQLLFNKMVDLPGATIGGYFLLLAGEFDRMHDWTHNLDERFPFLPDGAVISGWRYLREGKPDFALARQRFLEAASRGLPVYTSGLRLLHDGLTMMSSRARQETKSIDEAVESALRRLRPYAANADWTSATTSFYGERPPLAE